MFDYDTDFFGLFVLLWMIIVSVILLIRIIGAIGEYKMFKKAEKSGWPAFIPIYNDYILCTITGVNPWWVLFDILASVIGVFIPIIGTALAVLVPIYFRGLLAIATAKSYGKSDGWAVGIFLLKPFFYLALGFGTSSYLGEKAPNDVILEGLGINNKKEEVKEANVKNESTTDSKYCPNCGTKVEVEGSKYCINCGKEI